MISRVLLTGAVVISLTAMGASAQTLPAPGGEKTATAPAATDHVKDLFDDYTQGRERGRFFAAAGVDGALTVAEYQAAAGKADSFVRSYDNWQAAVVHDADKDGKLTWAEADQYREGIRKRVLKMFDKDTNGKLTGAERDEANKYLSKGLRAPRAAGPGRRPGQFPRQYDTNGDGRIDETERAAMTEAARKRAEQRRQAMELRRFDADKDGKLSDVERAAADKARADQQAQVDKRRQEMLATYDTDKDGQISRDERRAMRQAQRAQQQLERWDTDKDGALSEQERQAQREHFREQGRRRMRQWAIRRHDKDGDGVLNEKEQAAADSERQRWQASRGQMRKRYEEWRKRWDTDEDGQLSAEERRAAQDQARAEMERRRKEIDTDGDGRVSGEEIRAYMKTLTDKYDADGDGQLNAEERATLIREESRSFMPAGGRGRRRGGRGGRGRRGRRSRDRGAQTEPSEGAAGTGDTAEGGAVIIPTAP